MQRLALGVEYVGTDYHGWQRQERLPSIEQTLSEAIAKVADHPVAIFAAGRTDQGVHATNQIIHVDIERPRPDSAWILGVNSFLPRAIRVHFVKAVDSHFHARFSATARRYRYVIHNSRVRSAVLDGRVTWHPVELNLEKMQAASQFFVGAHDFTSIRGKDCQARSPIKNVLHCEVIAQGAFIVIDVKANGFLHHMVRNMAGVLLAIGEGKEEPNWVKDVLAARDRSAASTKLPPTGLYLVEVDYPAIFNLPRVLCGPIFLNLD